MSSLGSSFLRRAVYSFSPSLSPAPCISTTFPSRGLSSSLPHYQDPAASDRTVRPYSEIPSTKTTLGLNMDLVKDPKNMPKYMEKQTRLHGNIYRLTGAPGMPELLCVTDPRDAETVFRAGDTDIPKRFSMEEWKLVRKELKKPTGLFLM